MEWGVHKPVGGLLPQPPHVHGEAGAEEEAEEHQLDRVVQCRREGSEHTAGARPSSSTFVAPLGELARVLRCHPLCALKQTR